MKLAAIAFSDRGIALGTRLQVAFPEELTLTRCPEGGLATWCAAHFSTCDGLLFLGAAGIAVRAIAPFVTDKTKDPAVLVLDEAGHYVISLLSGHIGGGNALARVVAERISAIPILTTATDVNGVFAVDTWASERGLHIANPARIKWVSARLLAGETVRLKSLFPVTGALPPGLCVDESEYDILITHRTRGRESALRLVPPVVTLGVGCKRGVSEEVLEEAFLQVLAKTSCHPAAVCRVCSIDRKAEEPGLLAFCARHALPLQTFSPETLAALPGQFSSSNFVKKVTGVDNVCERSAVRGSGGTLLTGKNTGNGTAMALAIAPYTVSFEEAL